MKKLLLIIAAAALGGCAVAPPGPAYYGSRPVGQTDPNGWQVVSVTPVAPGTGARASASGDTGMVTSSTVQYAPAPVYAATPVYVPTPVYAPSPYLYDPFWYPPVSIGLGFNFGGGWGGHRGGWGHGGRGGFHHR
jgi:hypothetical protein